MSLPSLELGRPLSWRHFLSSSSLLHLTWLHPTKRHILSWTTPVSIISHFSCDPSAARSPLSARICWPHPCRSRLSSCALSIVMMPPPSPPPFRPLRLASPSLSAHGSVSLRLTSRLPAYRGACAVPWWIMVVPVTQWLFFMATAMVWHLSEPNLDSIYTGTAFAFHCVP